MSPSMRPLDEDSVIERNRLLTEILLELSETTFTDKSEFDKYCQKLSEVYSDDYRQMYSKIHPIVMMICKKDPQNLDILTNNLEEIRTYIGDQISKNKDLNDTGIYTITLYNKIFKLSDHVSIENQRILDSLETAQNLEKTYRTNEALNEQRLEFDEKLRKTKVKIKKMHTETVTILGIFSAVVMTFAGGLTFFGSSVQNIANTSPFKISFVIVVCGFIVFNTIAFLMDYINQIRSDPRLESEPQYDSFWKRYGRIIVVNAVFLALLLADLALWHCSNGLV